MTQFAQDLSWGEEGEAQLKNILNSLPSVKTCKKVPHTDAPYDLKLTTNSGAERGIEVKRLRGGYPTGVVEIWRDTEKRQRPLWHSDKTDYIFFKDESKNYWYMYNAQDVIKYLHQYDGHMTWARSSSKSDSGWIVKFEWEGGMPGFIKKFKGD